MRKSSSLIRLAGALLVITAHYSLAANAAAPVALQAYDVGSLAGQLSAGKSGPLRVRDRALIHPTSIVHDRVVRNPYDIAFGSGEYSGFYNVATMIPSFVVATPIASSNYESTIGFNNFMKGH